jgi:predicted nuclease of predicted toxin-antitoxin system
MKLLLDECLPRPLKNLLREHDCRTSQELGWSAKSNGALLALAEGKFDVLLTADQGFEYQQNSAGRKLAVVVLHAPSNKLEDLAPLIPGVMAALRSIGPGQIIRIPD